MNFRIDKAQLVKHINSHGPVGLLRHLGVRHISSGQEAKAWCIWHDEKTPSLSVRRGNSGDVVAWCFGCQHSADSIDLVSKAIGVEDLGFGERLEAVAKAVGFSSDTPWDGRVVKPEIPEEVLNYPPRSQIEMMWAAADGPDDLCGEVMPACHDMHRVKDMARIILNSDEESLGFDFWPGRGGHLIVKGYDAAGEWRSIHGRALDPRQGTKTLWPKGYHSKGLFFADKAGLEILQGKTGRGDNRRVIILTEGLTDSVNLACWYARRQEEGRPIIKTLPGAKIAVIGIHNGSSRHFGAVRWPKRAKYIIATDQDDAGDRYAKDIIEALPRSAQWSRATPRMDENLRRQREIEKGESLSAGL